ncbi:unnamed protein product [Peronospora destructor]|uniref:glucan endo-1,3-beta-D-glucosidase n=1 Tax=Peronospora destructor TaxID=86335 RepID=A0AAV0U596_9STRA|nr:unnamed protein product [Peronospora destructor]
MVCAIYKTIFAMLAAIACSSTQADLAVAYSPWNHEPPTADIIGAELKLLAQDFSVFRSYQTMAGNVNLVKAAYEAHLQIDVGIDMTDETKIDLEIKAVCSAYKLYSQTIRTVYVGNENLLNNGFGKYSVSDIVQYIKQVQQCVGAEVRVGTAQRINEWLTVSRVEEIVEVSTANGANIYPFFSDMGILTPVKMLQAQWDQLATKFDMTNFRVSETGWPTAGEEANGNTASVEVAQQYLADVTLWSVSKTVIWFMFSDSIKSYNGMETEKHFGIYDATCSTKKLVLSAKQMLPNMGNTTSLPTLSKDQPVQQNPAVPSKDQPEQQNPAVPSKDQPEQQNAENHSTPVNNETGKPSGTTGKDCAM